MSISADPSFCHVCGQEVDAVFDGEGWCAGCLHAHGSCCGEAEKDGAGSEDGSKE